MAVVAPLVRVTSAWNPPFQCFAAVLSARIAVADADGWVVWPNASEEAEPVDHLVRHRAVDRGGGGRVGVRPAQRDGGVDAEQRDRGGDESSSDSEHDTHLRSGLRAASGRGRRMLTRTFGQPFPAARDRMFQRDEFADEIEDGQ
jgi:hypothetical protein